jgi:small subunit ribosomal protein S2
MAVVTTRQLLDAGVHFGHQTRRWNPKMKRFIFGERNGIYIIDLQQSLGYIDAAYAFVKETVAKGGQILFIGTKKQAQEAIAEQATRVGMPYVNQRWLGGMLTNFQTISKRIAKMKELEGINFDNVAASGLTKKELLQLKRQKDKLAKTLTGIRDMGRVPQAVWIVDTNKEHLAIDEARKLGIPIIGVLDTNCDPDQVDFPIPGNDDAIRAVGLLTRVVADAVAEGLLQRSAAAATGEEVEPIPDWERELLAGGAEDVPAAQVAAEAAPVTAEAAPVAEEVIAEPIVEAKEVIAEVAPVAEEVIAEAAPVTAEVIAEPIVAAKEEEVAEPAEVPAVELVVEEAPEAAEKKPDTAKAAPEVLEADPEKPAEEEAPKADEA